MYLHILILNVESSVKSLRYLNNYSSRHVQNGTDCLNINLLLNQWPVMAQSRRSTPA